MRGENPKGEVNMKLAIGLILIFGSVGAFEVGTIHIARFIFQEIIGIYFLVNGIARLYKKY